MHGAELLVQELGVLFPGGADGAPGLQSQLHDGVQVHEPYALVLREQGRVRDWQRIGAQ